MKMYSVHSRESSIRAQKLPTIGWVGSWLCLLTIAVAGCQRSQQDTESSGDVETAEKSQSEPDPSVLNQLPSGQYIQTLELLDGSYYNFTISIPEGYDGTQTVPLILSLHFGGRKNKPFYGRDMLTNVVYPALQELNAIMIGPDAINNSWTNQECIDKTVEFLNRITQTYQIDRSKVLVIGYSLGGNGVWHFARSYPDFFTAAISVAGQPPGNALETQWRVPFYIIHSDKDEVVPIDRVRNPVEALQARGENFYWHQIDGISHYEAGKCIEPIRQTVPWLKHIWGMPTENVGSLQGR